ncbi:uncharacterized protein LOC125681115 [Ostrea edulis]|uniref:uncharacterized protein LOC125681115 n=1 Tax=Ostrea edulis TaxID=37623 RepID=UPI0024AF38EB|nr:uncharacterized protein LOC125681115 [Ostrea edulis]
MMNSSSVLTYIVNLSTMQVTMCVTTSFLVLSFIIQSNSKRLNVSTKACEMHVAWDKSDYWEFEIIVKPANDNATFRLYTNDRQFIYHPTEANGKYEIQWTPITMNGTQQNRVVNGTEKETVVLNGCQSIDNFTTAAVEPRCQTNDFTTAAAELQFYTIYFWTSLVTLSVLVIATGIFLYVCVLRRNRAFKRIRNNAPLSRPPMDVSSTCYDNSTGNAPVYDEVRYSLVRDTRL